MSRRYSRTSDPQLNDLSYIWDESNSDWRLSTFNDILTLFEENFEGTGVQEPNSQYSSPNTTGFSIQITDTDEDNHLILTPTATLAAGTIVLPHVANVRDKQICIVNCTQQITTFTVDPNGASAAHGAPTSLGADDFFTLKYDSTNTSWYRIG